MPGYATKQESIAIAGADNLIIRSLLDRQQFADPQGLAEALGISSAMWPLFGLLWPSGAQLAARMAVRPLVAGERILEIGCGLGLASLVSHRRGADVTASDCHPLAAGFLLENLRLNHLEPMKYRHGHWGAADRAARDDGEAHPAADVAGDFELLMGSDVLYERDDGGGLARFVGLHAAPTSDVWIVDPDRGNRAKFSQQMALLGFDLQEERLDRVATPLVAAYKGRLLMYHRGAALLAT